MPYILDDDVGERNPEVVSEAQAKVWLLELTGSELYKEISAELGRQLLSQMMASYIETINYEDFELSELVEICSNGIKKLRWMSERIVENN